MSFPNRGEGSPTWEKFPHFPVFFIGERPLVDIFIFLLDNSVFVDSIVFLLDKLVFLGFHFFILSNLKQKIIQFPTALCTLVMRNISFLADMQVFRFVFSSSIFSFSWFLKEAITPQLQPQFFLDTLSSLCDNWSLDLWIFHGCSHALMKH